MANKSFNQPAPLKKKKRVGLNVAIGGEQEKKGLKKKRKRGGTGISAAERKKREPLKKKQGKVQKKDRHEEFTGKENGGWTERKKAEAGTVVKKEGSRNRTGEKDCWREKTRHLR